jgi:hypothetical protein
MIWFSCSKLIHAKAIHAYCSGTLPRSQGNNFGGVKTDWILSFWICIWILADMDIWIFVDTDKDMDMV